MVRNFVLLILVLHIVIVTCHAVEVRLTEQGFEINAGAAGIHYLDYPKLATATDRSAVPEKVVLQPDGTEATMVYPSGGKLVISRQPDGGWLFHFTEIPPDKMKFWYGVRFPISLNAEGAAWSVNGAAPQFFPMEKGAINLYQGSPQTLAFHNHGKSFVVTCSKPTFVQVQDVRAWGKNTFYFAWCYYFPGKVTVPDILYSINIGTL